MLQDIDPNKPWLPISAEMLPKYAGDQVFIAVDKAVETYDYRHAPVWEKLAAVKNNQLYEIDGWRFWFTGPISILGQIEDIAKIVEERAQSDKK